jgi:hypothetical protein
MEHPARQDDRNGHPQVDPPAKAGGHTAKATPAHPEYEVRSDKSGKKAIHQADALKKK